VISREWIVVNDPRLVVAGQSSEVGGLLLGQGKWFEETTDH